MLSTLINGKHYKRVVIDYYDDLIAQLDVKAEETLKKFKNDDEFIKYENNKPLKYIICENDFLEQENEQLKDPFNAKYTFNDELLGVSNKSLFQDFVHVERMRGINQMKQLQKDRLDEITLAKTKPTSIEEALFGEKKFGFLVEIHERYEYMEMRVKFRLLAVVIDFYLDKDQIQQLENLIALDDDNYVMEVKGEIFDENCLQVYLLARYLRDQLAHNPNGECVKRVSKTELYAIEKIELFVGSELRKPLQIIAFNGQIDLSRLKSLHYIQCKMNDLQFYQTYRYDYLNLRGLSNLECLELSGLKLDFMHYDPFANIDTNKLRQLRLNCYITNFETDFFKKFLNLEILSISFGFYETNSFLFQSLSDLKNLKLLSLQEGYRTEFKIENYDFLKEMINLVTFNFFSKRYCPIADDTFKELRNLENLSIHAKKGKWMRHLTRLRSLGLHDMGSEDDQDDDVNYFDYLPNLCELRISYSSHIEDSFNGLKKLHRLSLELPNTFENAENVFEGLDQLTTLELSNSIVGLDTLKGSHSLSLRELSIKHSRIEMDNLDSFPNLKCLQLYSLTILDLKFLEHQNLTRLEISDCGWLDIFPDNYFTNLKNLSELHLDSLDSNILANANAFNGLENLIEFSCIRIGNEFNVDILSRMPKLQRLVLDRRMRNSIDVNLMKTQFPNIYSIRFY